MKDLVWRFPLELIPFDGVKDRVLVVVVVVQDVEGVETQVGIKVEMEEVSFLNRWFPLLRIASSTPDDSLELILISDLLCSPLSTLSLNPSFLPLNTSSWVLVFVWVEDIELVESREGDCWTRWTDVGWAWEVGREEDEVVDAVEDEGDWEVIVGGGEDVDFVGCLGKVVFVLPLPGAIAAVDPGSEVEVGPEPVAEKKDNIEGRLDILWAVVLLVFVDWMMGEEEGEEVWEGWGGIIISALELSVGGKRWRWVSVFNVKTHSAGRQIRTIISREKKGRIEV